MFHQAKVEVDFPFYSHSVYEALTDLGRYPKWTAGMQSVSFTGTMFEGLRYDTKTEVLGKINEAHITVLRLVADRFIVLQNSSGIVQFEATYELVERQPQHTIVSCDVHLHFSKALFNLAQPVVEAIAESRIRTDLETLRAQLSAQK